MSPTLEKAVAEIERLPKSSQRELADWLWEQLDDDEVPEPRGQAWLDELADRNREMLEHPELCKTWEEVRINARLAAGVPLDD